MHCPAWIKVPFLIVFFFVQASVPSLLESAPPPPPPPAVIIKAFQVDTLDNIIIYFSTVNPLTQHPIWDPPCEVPVLLFPWINLLCYPVPQNQNFILILLITPSHHHQKQVAQRATIAHLSPMCQGQISFQKTYKWAMETRGPKSNSSELLCLSWLPATLMTIWMS